MGVASGCALAWLVALSVYDIRQRRLPNALTLPGAAAVLLVAVVSGRGAPAVAGALALFAVYLVVYLLVPAVLGGGDVKLAPGVGALTGAFGVDVWLLAALGAPLLTSVIAVLCRFRRSRSAVPHGPSMCVTAAAAVALAL